METKEFGVRLKELRRQAGLSQRELAGKIGVNFSYLSKIESGVMPPPSEKIILRLAEALNADKDELMLLAGKIPSDIAQILKNREALQLLRASHAREKTKIKKEGISIMKNLVNYKRLSKIAIPIVLVCAVAASLWFASPMPAKALEIIFPSLPTGTLGTTHSFTIKVDITSTELVPIQSINLEIYNVADPSKKATCTNLPLTHGGSKYYSNTATGGGGTVSVTASAINWQWLYGYGYAVWQGTAYPFGYGYGYGGTIASLTFTGTWTSPSGWPEGGYRIKVSVNAQSATLTQTFIKTSSSFTLSAPVVVPPGPVVIKPGVVDVSQVVTASGNFTQSVTIKSEDNKVQLTINQGVTGKTKEGTPLSQISVTPMTTPPAPPAQSNVIGLTYDLGPDGATFSPPITITFTYDPTKVPTNTDLSLAYYNKATSTWVPLEGIKVGPGNIISGKVGHFTAFTVIAYSRPAVFTVSALSISPTEVDIGKSVTISAVVTNAGGLTGSYEVTLKIDNAVVETKTVTVAGGASETVTFTTAKDVTGTYTVNVNGLSDTFTVKAVEVPARPAAFTTSALTISPTEVDIGESVTISTVVTNTGDLTGSYEVTLKIDNAVVETKTVTLAGGGSQTVTFTTAKDVAGTYTVNVNGLSGTFTVKVVELPPVGPAWWVWLIVGLAAAAVVGVVIWLVVRRRRV